MAKQKINNVMSIFIGVTLMVIVQVVLLTYMNNQNSILFTPQRQQHQNDVYKDLPSPLHQSTPACQDKDKKHMVVPADSFGACLIVMDDNHFLPEWLSYHYQTLPLRRLIVAVDPRSKTSPSYIFERFRSHIHITEWSDVDFMPPHAIVAHKKIPHNDSERIENLYLDRQKHFYARCMAIQKMEQRNSWVAIIDSDEYILPNPYIVKNYPYRLATDPSKFWDLNQTILELLQNIPKWPKHMGKGCIAMHRLQYGTKESTIDQVQSMVPTGDFNGTDFVTTRWRYHAGLKNKTFNKLVKSMVDLSVIEEINFHRDNMNPHLPLKTHCHLRMLKLPNEESMFLVNHYIGTLEEFSYRDDVREKRRDDQYQLLHFDIYQDDFIRPWLRHFVDNVGIDTAKVLLEGAGKLEPK